MHPNFQEVFGTSTDRAAVIVRALDAGLKLVLNQANKAESLCPLGAAELRFADELAGDRLRQQGKISAADKMKHECGLGHTLDATDIPRVPRLVERLGNNINIGVNLGGSKLLAVNCDTSDQIKAFLRIWSTADHVDHSEDTPTILTPGELRVRGGEDVLIHKDGAHWLFWVPEGVELPEGNGSSTVEGFSLMWGDSQTLVPPSYKNGAFYKLMSEPQELTGGMLEIIGNLGVKLSEETPPEPVREGQHSAFARMAKANKEAGWCPIPTVLKAAKGSGKPGWVPYHSKPNATTGASGKDLGDEEIERFCASSLDYGLANRMPEGIIGIDVDGYEGKVGAETFRRLEAKLGPLPKGYRNTARGEADKVSGHRFFKVPKDVKFIAKITGGDIDILRRDIRYANVGPTNNAKTGLPYLYWDDRTGEVMDAEFVPLVEDLFDLPEAWIEELTLKPRKVTPGKVAEPATTEDNAKAMRIMRWSLQRLADTQYGSRNDQLYKTSCLLGHLICSGIITIEQAENAITGPCEANGSVEEDFNEVQATFISGMTRGMETPWETEHDESVEEDGYNEYLDLWQQRPFLAFTHHLAKSKSKNPWSMLMVNLARMLSAVDPSVVLPETGTSGYGSLNMYVTLFGPVGKGKTSLMDVSEQYYKITNAPDLFGLPTGEGLCAIFVGSGDKVNTRRGLVFVDEASALQKAVDRVGSTFFGTLRSMWVGRSAGQQNSSQERRRNVKKHSYRLCFILGMQELYANFLLNATEIQGGTPHRFIWAAVQDPDATRESFKPDPPEPMRWETPPWMNSYSLGMNDNNSVTGGFMVMTYHPQVAHEINEALLDELYSDSTDLVEHAVYMRCKLAGALALSEGRRDISVDDWLIAKSILMHSDANRNLLTSRFFEAKDAVQAKEITAKAWYQVNLNKAEARILEEKASELAERLKTKYSGRKVSKSAITVSCNSFDRSILEESFSLLMVDGVIIETSERINGSRKPTTMFQFITV